MKFFFVINLILASLNASALSSWSIEVAYEDKEIKTYSFGDTASELVMGNFPWKCKLSEVENYSNPGVKTASRFITCHKGNQSISTIGNCSTGNYDAGQTLRQMYELMGSPRQTIGIFEGKRSRRISSTCKVL